MSKKKQSSPSAASQHAIGVFDGFRAPHVIQGGVGPRPGGGIVVFYLDHCSFLLDSFKTFAGLFEITNDYLMGTFRITNEI